MHVVNNLIWSAVVPQERHFWGALDFCQGLGGGSRLPSKAEYIALATAMGKDVPGKTYNPDLLPGINVAGRYLWSGTSGSEKEGPGHAHVFAQYGSMTLAPQGYPRAFRCVTPAK